ncbi:hypothetical protein C8Q74DRAFT_766343 [Fomes fomentarius]|nr:hypothetical protein C8Q74DRAFT_766343 [Fomes fomentarius]
MLSFCCCGFPGTQYLSRDCEFDERKSGRLRLWLGIVCDTVLSTNPRLPSLPTELWMGIIAHISDIYTLTKVMRVNHFFSELAEATLYHKVTLKTNDAVAKFSQSVSCCGRRALLVHELRLSATPKLDPRMPYCLKSILSAVHNVQHLTLVASAPQHCYFLNDFLADHPGLEELHLKNLYPGLGVWDPRVHLPSLRVLSCKWQLLSPSFHIPPTLTRLHLICPIFRDLPTNLCIQLVSLRLGAMSPGYLHRLDPAHRPLALQEVRRRFPSLRYLQVDMQHPYYEHVIAWKGDSTSRVPVSSGSLHRMTVAWVYARPTGNDYLRISEMRAIKDAALGVLTESGHIVERIIFRHMMISCVSASLSEDGMRLVLVQDEEMSEDYWRLFPDSDCNGIHRKASS